MALLYRGADGAAWATGAARLLSEIPVGPHVLPVALCCRIGESMGEEIALLDTGAAWSVVHREVVEAVGLAEDPDGALLTITSRFGSHSGRVTPLPLTLLAEDGWGDDLEVSARAVVMDDWPGPVVLGYHGVLETVRLAIDPGVLPGDAYVYFGPCS